MTSISLGFVPFGATLIHPTPFNQLSLLSLEKGFNETLIMLFLAIVSEGN
ncbi:hypothetical protein KAI30_04835 [Candidatus Bathyarchaeota archaeon]|nr:hypothetical protein [Candidatus Bathyarchaeota archaeon]